uniref:Uncharacterized protein n=1 Tax=Rhizophora mucronata TaxID=61149 RepID=A0A2P2P5C9_RHIMU
MGRTRFLIAIIASCWLFIFESSDFKYFCSVSRELSWKQIDSV